MNQIKPQKPPTQRQEPYRDRKYLTYVRGLSCVLSGARGDNIDPAHIGTLGRGMKFHDWGVLPLRHDLHMKAHAKGEMTFWRENLSDADLRAALQLFARWIYFKPWEEGK